MEVIHNLGKYSCKVDRINRTELQSLVRVGVFEDRFDDVLVMSSAHSTGSSVHSKLTWQSSNVPFTAILWTFLSKTVVICASWIGLTRPFGCRMNIDTSFLPLRPAIAADPV